MALGKTYSVRNAEPFGIFAREHERVRREIDGLQLGLWKTGGEGERNHSTAGADVEHTRVFRPDEVAEIFDQLFGFGARDKCAFVAQENVVGEFDRSEKVLERLALAASPYEFAQRRQLRLGERPLELEIKLDSIFCLTNGR